MYNRGGSNLFSKIVVGFIVFTFIVILAWWGFIGFLGYKTVSVVGSDEFHGVKPIIEKAWCGKEGCLDK